MAIARQRLTLEHFLQLPEEKPALEYWRGEVSQKMSPKGPHSALQGELGYRISSVAVPHRIARVFPEARVTFAGESVVPDLVVYRWERIPRDADGRVAMNFLTPPDIAVEIGSPGQSRRSQIEPCRWYVANGVALAIFADPIRELVRLFRPGTDSGDLRSSDIVDLGDIIPGFSLSVHDFFAPLDADYA